jgi:hypothetical protein
MRTTAIVMVSQEKNMKTNQQVFITPPVLNPRMRKMTLYLVILRSPWTAARAMPPTPAMAAAMILTLQLGKRNAWISIVNSLGRSYPIALSQSVSGLID